MKRLIPFGAAVLMTFTVSAASHAQARPLPGADLQKVYDRLLKQIDQIPIYDNHSHATFPDDSDMDAMASPPDESTVLRLRDTNPEFVAAAKALFGYPYEDFSPAHAKWLIDKKKAAEAAGGTVYWDSILDKMNIETCLANRVALAPYLDPNVFAGSSSWIRSCSPSTIMIRPARTATWPCTSRSRKKFCSVT
jgi:hypothetical protein